LDIGSGGGIDCFEASRRVGPTGRVIGIDMTDTMIEIARRHAPAVASNLGHPRSNVEFLKGMADNMPVENDCVDLVISNCVINLAPDKPKVFREMFRIIKPGGRFTISDIVADQVVPQYLVHDHEKWGNCLSGALTVRDYMGGMVQAGFVGVHQVKFTPWQVIDGIHFLSLTLTGYKLTAAGAERARFATLRGPFKEAVDEHGRVYARGVPQAVDALTATLLRTEPFAGLFLLSETPRPLTSEDLGYLAILPENTPCIWTGDFAMLTGPFIQTCDDDHHVYRRGEPIEICSKTLKVLDAEPYRRHFAVINRAGTAVNGAAVSCAPGGSCC
jgi:SAM-dependent methyltransferase